MKTKRKTAGELSIKAASDSTRYDMLEVAHALTDDIREQLEICANRHIPIFDETEFCLILIVAKDPLISNLRRHKYYAYPYLPSPRPQQTVFLFNKITHGCQRLWSLPDAKTMAVISEMPYVHLTWQQTKAWCDSFFRGTFWQDIRAEHSISLLSETEFLQTHRTELIEASGNNLDALLPESFDFSKITEHQVIDKYKPILD